MNIKTFKRLIKEAVAEAIYEELPNALNEVLKQKGQPINENRTLNFTSADVSPLSKDIRNSLASKMGDAFGVKPVLDNIPSELTVIDAVNESGEKVNPYLAFLADSAANLTPQDRAGLGNLEI